MTSEWFFLVRCAAVTTVSLCAATLVVACGGGNDDGAASRRAAASIADNESEPSPVTSPSASASDGGDGAPLRAAWTSHRGPVDELAKAPGDAGITAEVGCCDDAAVDAAVTAVYGGMSLLDFNNDTPVLLKAAAGSSQTTVVRVAERLVANGMTHVTVVEASPTPEAPVSSVSARP